MPNSKRSLLPLIVATSLTSFEGPSFFHPSSVYEDLRHITNGLIDIADDNIYETLRVSRGGFFEVLDLNDPDQTSRIRKPRLYGVKQEKLASIRDLRRLFTELLSLQQVIQVDVDGQDPVEKFRRRRGKFDKPLRKVLNFNDLTFQALGIMFNNNGLYIHDTFEWSDDLAGLAMKERFDLSISEKLIARLRDKRILACNRKGEKRKGKSPYILEAGLVEQWNLTRLILSRLLRVDEL